VAFFSGLLFSAGLCLSGMTRPSKVIAFLDVTGRWDPSLAFVMLGAIGIAAVAFRAFARHPKPILGDRHGLPDARAPIEPRLVIGASLFGAGWGLSGLCPGPAVVSLASGQVGTLVFVATMLGGMALSFAVERVFLRSSP